MATTGDLRPQNTNRFTNAALARDHTRRLRVLSAPKFFSVPAPVAQLCGDSAMTQPGACRNAAVPKRDARADAPEVEQTVGSHRLPAAPLSSRNFRGPEVLRPRLTAGLPLSAFGPKAAVHSSELNRRRSVVLRYTSSRSHRRPVRRAASIDTHRAGTRGNLSHIADITRGLPVGPAMNSSPISEVQTKSRGCLSDLCHMRYLRDFRTRKSCEFPGQPSTRVEQFGTVHEPQARNEFAGCATRGVRYELVRPRAVVRPLNFRHRGRCLR